MPAEILDGKAIAKQIQAETKQKVADFVASGGPQPKLAAVLVGEDPASQVYVRNKERACKRAGIASELVRMPAETTTEQLLAKVNELNADAAISGILVQLPLPDQIDFQARFGYRRSEQRRGCFPPAQRGFDFSRSSSFLTLYTAWHRANAQALQNRNDRQKRLRDWSQRYCGQADGNDVVGLWNWVGFRVC